MQAVTTGATGDRERTEEGALQQYILRFAIHARVLATKDTAHGQGFVVVGNHQRIGLQFSFATVEQHQRLVLLRHPNNDPALNAAQIEGVHRLTQLQQDEVSDVYHSDAASHASTAGLAR